jgi:uncharacterized protein (DUF488 family)
MEDGMLYSIGYQDKPIDFFIHALKGRKVEFLLDLRSRPSSKIASYNQNPLRKRLEQEGISYSWGGDTLGGFKVIKESEIRRLASWQANKTAAMMCMESDPAKCHRGRIAQRLVKYGVSVKHIVREGDSIVIMKGGEANEGHSCANGTES